MPEDGRGGGENDDPPTVQSVFSAQLENELAASLSNSLTSLNVNNEALIMGSRNGGQMPPIRKNFCLFVLFDFLVVSFIWLILKMLSGNGDLIAMFKNEIVHYSIESSLFDLVMTAACRFTVLLLFYGLMEFSTTLFVALTTAGTCGFLIAKVLYYDWNKSSQTAMEGTSMLVSFTLAWVEVWFLDLRVIPQEQYARTVISQDGAIRSESNRFIGLARNFFERNSTAGTRSGTGGGFSGGSNFYTPMPSTDASDDEGEVPHRMSDKRGWLKVAKKLMEIVVSLLDSSDWKHEKKTGDATVLSTRQGDQEYFRIETVLKVPPEQLYKEIFENIDGMSQWNPNVEECSRIASINSNCDLILQKLKILGINSRDLIILRKAEKIQNYYVVAFQSVQLPDFPEMKNSIRGYCGPSCWAFKEVEDEPWSCKAIGIINSDMMLKIPNRMIRMGMISSLLQITKQLRILSDKLNSP